MNNILSIIVPVYGVEKYLRQCVDSILLACTGVSAEVLLIDDGSKDKCPTICDDYANRFDKIVKVIHKKNGGYGSAVNMGLNVAQGEWISIVEPDDWIDKEMYVKLLSESHDPCVDIIKGNFIRVYDTGEKRVNRWDCNPPQERFTINACPIFLGSHPSIWCAVYRKSFLDKFHILMKEVPGGGWTDNPFLVETMCQARGIMYVDQPVYNYRVAHDDVVALKGNWHIPYNRMMEIHEWFRRNEISNVNILCARYRAHLSYLYTMSRFVNKQNRKELTQAISLCARSFCDMAIYGSNVMSTVEKLLVFNYRYFPYFQMFRNTHPWFNRFYRVGERCYGCFLIAIYSWCWRKNKNSL